MYMGEIIKCIRYNKLTTIHSNKKIKTVFPRTRTNLPTAQ